MLSVVTSGKGVVSKVCPSVHQELNIDMEGNSHIIVVAGRFQMGVDDVSEGYVLEFHLI